MPKIQMPEFIAGKPVPKWVGVDEEIGAVILNNMENKQGSLSQHIEAQEKAKTARALAGVCEKCRQTNCLCREGQA